MHSQANSDRSAQAIPAYHRALELKPKYARGWLNLGISHANLSDYAVSDADACRDECVMNPDSNGKIVIHAQSHDGLD